MNKQPHLAFTLHTPLRLHRHPLRPPAPPRKSRSPPVAVQQQSRPVHTPSLPVRPPQPATSAPPTSQWLLSYLTDLKTLVDSALDSCLSATDSNTAKIIESMRYSLLAGGKRIRPALTIAAYQMFAGPDAPLHPVVPAALAVEMIHTMSLIHDDLPSMDDDQVRRGKPTNHVKFGEDIAILAGDALLAYAFEYVARETRDVEPKRVVDVIALLAASVGPQGLAGGQVMDLEHEGDPDVDLDTLTWIHTHKTATLLRVSVAAGAIVGGASEDDVKRLSRFAVKTGLAFQIADDVLDVTQSTEVLGKTAGKDEATDKATYPKLLGLEGSRRQAENLIAEAKECLQPYGAASYTLLALADFIINRSS